MTTSEQLRTLILSPPYRDYSREDALALVNKILVKEFKQCGTIRPDLAKTLYERFGNTLHENFFQYMSPLSCYAVLSYAPRERRLSWCRVNYADRVKLAMEHKEVALTRLKFNAVSCEVIAEFLNSYKEPKFIRQLTALIHITRIGPFLSLVDTDIIKYMKFNATTKTLFKHAMNHNELFNIYFPYSELNKKQSSSVLACGYELSEEAVERLKVNVLSANKLEQALLEADRLDVRSSRKLVLRYINDPNCIDDPEILEHQTVYSVKSLLLIRPELAEKLPIEILSGEDILTLILDRHELVKYLDVNKIAASSILTKLEEDNTLITILGRESCVKIILNGILTSPMIDKKLLEETILSPDVKEQAFQLRI